MSQQFNQLFPTKNTVKATGLIRVNPEDFRVNEINQLSFTEQGEHLWLYIEKKNTNTAWLVKQLAKACNVHPKQIGYAGQKDRHAITQQWFSVQLPKTRELDLIQKELPEDVKITKNHWHQSKLKTGFLDANQFKIRIRDIDGCKDLISTNLSHIEKIGVPNYFGPQRFGHDMANIQKAQDWFEDKIRVRNKNLRGLLISTARSYIFNLILAKRIKDDTWDKVIEGDVFQLNGSHSWFPESAATADEIQSRLKDFDIHLTAALWGEDEVQSTAICAKTETAIANKFPSFLKGFEKLRVKHDRRAIRLMPHNLNHEWVDNDLLLNFKLPPGAYATGVIREAVNYTDHQQSNID